MSCHRPRHRRAKFLLSLLLLGGAFLTGCEFDLEKRGRNTPFRTKRPRGFYQSGKIPHKASAGDRQNRIMDRWLRGMVSESEQGAMVAQAPPRHRETDVAEFPRTAPAADPGPAVSSTPRGPVPRANGAPRTRRPRGFGGVGQTARPAPTRTTVASRTPSPDRPGRFHTVKRGETFLSISAQHRVSPEGLKRWNPNEARTGLAPGQILYVPASKEQGGPGAGRSPVLSKASPAPPRRSPATSRSSRSNRTVPSARIPGAPPPSDAGPSTASTTRTPPGSKTPASKTPASQTPSATAVASKPPKAAPPPSPGQKPDLPRGTEVGGGSKIASKQGFVWPVEGEISSPFGWRNGKPHTGLDIRAPKGTAVVASQAGKVIFAGKMSGYGNTIILDHLNGFFTVYGHNSVNVVKRAPKGQTRWVKRGQLIAKVGETGNATGPHLHFEVRKLNNPVDPVPYLPRVQLASR